MRVLHADPLAPDPVAIADAARIIRSGGLVAFPTETVYGLGANALDPKAVAGIFTAKSRPAWNPVIVHVPDEATAAGLTLEWPDTARKIASELWPGPITVVLEKRPEVPDFVTAGMSKVAIRVPAHPVALALLRAAGCPIAAPSANRFSEVSPTTAAHVVQSLGDRVDLVLDGGPSEVGIESTVLDLSGRVPTILRPGMISRDRLEIVLGCSVEYRRIDDGARSAAAGTPEPSPGTALRHYAPLANVWLFETTDLESVQTGLSSRHTNDSKATRARALLVHVPDDALPNTEVVRMPALPDDYARSLYRELHAADASDVGLLIIERPPMHDAWAAIHDRLTRASR